LQRFIDVYKVLILFSTTFTTVFILLRTLIASEWKQSERTTG